MTTYDTDDQLPVGLFDESVTLEDPLPFRGWMPTPQQIADWSAVIRAVAELQRLDISRVAVAVDDAAADSDDDLDAECGLLAE